MERKTQREAKQFPNNLIMDYGEAVLYLSQGASLMIKSLQIFVDVIQSLP